MKITGLITLLIVIVGSCLIAQGNDTLNTEQEKISPVIMDDNEDEVSVGMDEIVKFDEKGDTTRLKIRDREFSVIDGDTTRIKIGDKNISIVEDDEGTSVAVTDSDDGKEDKQKKKKFKGHWTGIEFGLNNFVDHNFSMTRQDGEEFMDLNTGRSWNFNFNIKQYSVGFGTDRLGLVTGLGLEFNNYHFDGDNNIQEVNGNIVTKDDYPSSLTKSKLKTTFLTVPLLIELQLLQAKRSKRIHITGGVIGGLKLGSHSKVIYKQDGNRKKDKIKDDFNINPLRYGLTARIGYRSLNFYTNYYMTPFFEKDNDPELYPVAIGLSLAF